MEIVIGVRAGFCYGVKNAVNKSIEALKEKENVYCLGELVHNKQVVDELKENGMIVVSSIDEVPDNCNIIFRAHGISKEIYEIAQKRNINIIDLTCPSVLAVHKKAEKYSNDGYVLLVGEKEHPEVFATQSFIQKGSVIQDFDEIQKIVDDFNKSEFQKMYIIAQTTFSVEKFNNICDKIKELLPNSQIIVDNTICNTTQLRQEETIEMSKNVELMIIIGGKNSANTRKLYDISVENCKNAIIVQTKDDIDINFIKKFNKIGIMAGASTPEKSINDIVEYIKVEKSI